MTLLEACKCLNGKIIKVGAKNGYIYCGKVSPSTEAELESLKDEALEPLYKQLDKKRQEKAVFDEVWDQQFFEMQNRIKENHKNISAELFSRYYDRFQDLRDDAGNKLMDELNDIETQILSFVPFGDREVIEIRESICDADKIILIDGKESGRCWLVKDYQKGDLQ